MKQIAIALFCLCLISCNKEKTILPQSDIELVGGQQDPGPGFVESKIWNTQKSIYLSSNSIKILMADIEKVSISKDSFSWAIRILFNMSVDNEIYTLTKSLVSKYLVIRVNGRCVYAAKVEDPVRRNVSISGFKSESEAEATAKMICGF
jgi:hypothetical protein